MQPVVAHEAHAIHPDAGLAQRRLCGLRPGVPVEPDRAFALATADQHLQPLHRHVKLQRLHPLHRDAQRVVVAQIVELGAILALDRLDPQRLAPPVGLRAVAVVARGGGKAAPRGTAQVVMIAVDAVAVALEPAAHRAQKGLDGGVHLVLDQRMQACLQRCGRP